MTATGPPPQHVRPSATLQGVLRDPPLPRRLLRSLDHLAGEGIRLFGPLFQRAAVRGPDEADQGVLGEGPVLVVVRISSSGCPSLFSLFAT